MAVDVDKAGSKIIPTAINDLLDSGKRTSMSDPLRTSGNNLPHHSLLHEQASHHNACIGFQDQTGIAEKSAHDGNQDQDTLFSNVPVVTPSWERAPSLLHNSTPAVSPSRRA